MARRCPHPDRAWVGDRTMHCGACGKDFIPRGLPIKHGTIEGYNKHVRVHSGQWSVPACEKCMEAKRVWRREYDARPEAVRSRKIRTMARAAALEQLRRQYPAAYAVAYCRELEKRGGREVLQHYQVPDWEDILAKLIMAVTGRAEADAEEMSHAPYRVPADERETMLAVRRLRVILADRYHGVRGPDPSSLLLVPVGVVGRALEPECARRRHKRGGNSR